MAGMPPGGAGVVPSAESAKNARKNRRYGQGLRALSAWGKQQLKVVLEKMITDAYSDREPWPDLETVWSMYQKSLGEEMVAALLLHKSWIPGWGDGLLGGAAGAEGARDFADGVAQAFTTGRCPGESEGPERKPNKPEKEAWSEEHKLLVAELKDGVTVRARAAEKRMEKICQTLNQQRRGARSPDGRFVPTSAPCRRGRATAAWTWPSGSQATGSVSSVNVTRPHKKPCGKNTPRRAGRGD